MYLKLALRNIRRSVRDYAIYFITLLFGVAVFYAFNSIGSQQILFDMETSASQSVFDSTTYILGMFSVVVACVLGSFAGGVVAIRRCKARALLVGLAVGAVFFLLLLTVGVLFFETMTPEAGGIGLACGSLCGGAAAGILCGGGGKGGKGKKKRRK